MKVADLAVRFMSGAQRPMGQATREATEKVLSVFYAECWGRVAAGLPYVAPFVAKVQKAGLDTQGIIDEHGHVQPLRVDHYANRHFLDHSVPSVDAGHDFPQLRPLSGRMQTVLPLMMLGVEKLGPEITFDSRHVVGSGYQCGEYPHVILPRWFASDQHIDQLPGQYQEPLRESLRQVERPVWTERDWELLIAIDQGKTLSDAEYKEMGQALFTRMLSRSYQVNPELLEQLRQEEAAGKPWAEYTRNAYERGTDLNHGTIPVRDIPAATHLMESLGIPTVPDQGLGTQLEQGAAGAANFPMFLEYIHRIQRHNERGEPMFHEGTSEPVWLENGFTMNAQGIFAATSLKAGAVQKKTLTDRAEAAKKAAEVEQEESAVVDFRTRLDREKRNPVEHATAPSDGTSVAR